MNITFSKVYIFRKLNYVPYESEPMVISGFNAAINEESSQDSKATSFDTTKVQKVDDKVINSNSMTQADVMSIWNYLHDDNQNTFKHYVKLKTEQNKSCEELYYPLWTYPKGLYLIINIFRAKGLDDRCGSAKDVENLENVFNNLGLRVCSHPTLKQSFVYIFL